MFGNKKQFYAVSTNNVFLNDLKGGLKSKSLPIYLKDTNFCGSMQDKPISRLNTSANNNKKLNGFIVIDVNKLEHLNSESPEANYFFSLLEAIAKNPYNKSFKIILVIWNNDLYNIIHNRVQDLEAIVKIVKFPSNDYNAVKEIISFIDSNIFSYIRKVYLQTENRSLIRIVKRLCPHHGGKLKHGRNYDFEVYTDWHLAKFLGEIDDIYTDKILPKDLYLVDIDYILNAEDWARNKILNFFEWLITFREDKKKKWGYYSNLFFITQKNINQYPYNITKIFYDKYHNHFKSKKIKSEFKDSIFRLSKTRWTWGVKTHNRKFRSMVKKKLKLLTTFLENN